MKKIKRKKLDRLYIKIKNVMYMLPILLLMLQNKVFATSSSISTAEVSQATENIKNSVIKLAMPIRWNISICQHCSYCTQNDSKLK